MKTVQKGKRVIPETHPFLKWAGGKSQLLGELSKNLPGDFGSTVKTYVEPFVGGGAFLFHVLKSFSGIERIIINDANTALMNTYLAIRDFPDALLEKLSALQRDFYALGTDDLRQQYFYARRTEFNAIDSKDARKRVRKSALLIFLNKTCFNGLYRVNSKGEFNVPFGKYVNPLICNESLILADSEALRRVEMLNGDFTAAVEDVDENAFVYFDPPYRPLSETSSFCSYCEGNFNDDEQKRLACCCKMLHGKGVRWLQSNSNPHSIHPEDFFFDDLYAGFHFESVFAARMINSKAEKRGKLSELLIRNYEI